MDSQAYQKKQWLEQTEAEQRREFLGGDRTYVPVSQWPTCPQHPQQSYHPGTRCVLCARDVPPFVGPTKELECLRNAREYMDRAATALTSILRIRQNTCERGDSPILSVSARTTENRMPSGGCFGDALQDSSPRTTTNTLNQFKGDCAPSVKDRNHGEIYTSTTTTARDVCARCFAATAIPGLVSSGTTQNDSVVPHGTLRFIEILREWAELHLRKNRDYGRSNDPYANVRASEEWGIAPWVGALVRLTDKVRRLQVAAQGGTLANEGVIDSLDDIGVYAAIARVLYEESTR